MVYLMDEYIKKFPYREKIIKAALKDFLESNKEFHKMTLGEINEVLAEHKPISMSVIACYRAAIRNYLDWLASSGIETSPEIANEIIYPESIYSFVVYNTDMLHNLWEDFLMDYSISKETNGKTPRPETFLTCYATDILAFYGMTFQEIASLQLEDVTKNGIRGYDLPLTERDVDVLMEYKGLETTGNGKQLIGSTYIRTVSGEILSDTFDSAIRKIKAPVDCTIEMQPIKRVFGFQNMFQLGVYNRMYEYEKAHVVKVKFNSPDPEWLAFFYKQHPTEREMTSRTFIQRFKRCYIQYREERNSYEKVIGNRAKGINVGNTVNEVLFRLRNLIDTETNPERKKALEEVKSIVSRLVK